MICQCKQLRSKHITFKAGARGSITPIGSNGGDLLMHFSAALPNLATLLWQQSA